MRARGAVVLLKRNADDHEQRLYADFDGTSKLAMATLDELAPVLGGEKDFRGDLAMLTRIEDALTEPTFRLRRLAFNLARVRLELQDADLGTMRWLAIPSARNREPAKPVPAWSRRSAASTKVSPSTIGAIASSFATSGFESCLGRERRLWKAAISRRP